MWVLFLRAVLCFACALAFESAPDALVINERRRRCMKMYSILYIHTYVYIYIYIYILIYVCISVHVYTHTCT